ncbi:saframycin Mx1 synthetase B [Legionella beliardensis]|uniref:Saframycin Mx1 synthetase B n=1 Tax=Legionella beliardensis TaxID=91822 RepID=A0A378I0M4_9GAMM|nr:HAD-IIIC family phosphatase [Legionella beliardensis]STX28747.1 saframycin Mx1 synthetase B [Legionella beliardensis]
MHIDSFNDPYQHLCDILAYRNANNPEGLAYRFLGPDEHEELLTSRELFIEVAKLANLLLEYAKPGNRVILAAQPGLEYIIGFFACLRAGMIAVPVFPPANPQMTARLLHIIADAKPSLILGDKPVVSSLKKGQLATRFLPNRLGKLMGLSGELASLFDVFKQQQLPVIATNQRKHYTTTLPPVTIDANTIAFLQYTSGSTGNPKGVVLTHKNLLANMAIIKQATRQTPQSHLYSWLPPYHDMGLIAGLLEPLYANIMTTYTSPQDFIRDPVRWVKHISKYRCTMTGGPNFAYELCARRVSEAVLATLDLSCLDVAVNGAEPVSAKTMALFYDTFKQAGLKQSALFPCYGLAEATLMVSAEADFSPKKVIQVALQDLSAHRVVLEDKSTTSVELVSSGKACVDVQIVDPNTQTRCQSDEVGEIWVHGDSIAQGYYQNEKETYKIFKNQIKDSNEPKEYLKTGDLGFFHDNHLFVCGRVKDLIIINGQNYYPQDLEKVVTHANAHIKKGNVIAFAKPGQVTERLVIVAELKGPADEEVYQAIITDIQKALSAAFHLTAQFIYLMPKRSIPKTTSGKLQRRKCAELIADDKIKALFAYCAAEDSQPVTDQQANATWLQALLSTPEVLRQDKLIAELQQLLAQVLNLPNAHNIDPKMNLFELGIDSLQLGELLTKLNAKLHSLCNLNAALILDNPTILHLADVIEKAVKKLDYNEIEQILSKHSLASQFEYSTFYPMTDRQLNFYLSDKLAPSKGAYNIAVAVKLNFKIDLSKLKSTLLKLITAHSVFKSKVKLQNDKLYVNEEGKALSLAQFFINIKCEDKELNSLFNQYTIEPFETEQGLLFRIILIECQGNYYLQLVAHHLIADGISLKLFVEQFLRLYHQNKLSRAHQYAEFASWLKQYKSLPQYNQAQVYWNNLIEHASSKSYLNQPKGWDIALNQDEINYEQSEQIKQFCRAHHISVQNLLMYSYYLVLSRKLATTQLTIGTLFSGRISERWQNTLGVFVNLLPVVFNYTSYPDVLQGIKNLQKQIIHSGEYADYTQPNRLLNSKNKKLFEFVFVYQVTSQANQGIDIVYKNNGLGLDPFVLEVRNDGTIELLVKYNQTLFSAKDIESFIKEMKNVCLAIVNNTLVHQNSFPVEKFDHLTSPKKSIGLLSTFTIEPIKPFIEYWFDQIDQHYDLEIGDFNQVIQNLINVNSLLYKHKVNFLFISLYDWFKDKLDESIITDLINALEFYAHNTTYPIFLMFTPPPPDLTAEINFNDMELTVQNHFKQVGTVYVKTHADFLSVSAVANYFDQLTYQQGSIPYTQELYLALATYSVRQLHCLQRAPKKVIVIDCDNTLWEGEIGEVSFKGIKINPNHLQLQAKLKELRSNGFLLALSSKNTLEDVQLAFEKRKEMVLKWSDIVLAKVDWNNKATNILAIAEALNLSLNSFIFIDDNPLECHAVKTALPDVEVIQFPKEQADIKQFLANIWSFDLPKKTKEDSLRTEFYNQEKYRESIKKSALNLNEFIKQLNLQINIAPLKQEDISRVSQLSMRTNQFNTTTIRRDESQIIDFVKQENSNIYTVSVADKFGDYGLVGVLMIYWLKDRLVVDSMLLSCRALGRGVEQQMQQKLIDLCQQNQVKTIEYKFIKTKRNDPAQQFLDSIYTKLNLDNYLVILS